MNCKIDTIHFDIPPLKSDTIIDVPFLKVTFQNLTGKNIYFKNPYQPKGQYPPIVPASMINTSMDLADQVRLSIIHQLGKSFIVEIEDGWSIYTEKTYSVYQRGEAYVSDAINDDLHNIYKVLLTQQVLNELGFGKQLSCFKYYGKGVIKYSQAFELIYTEKEKRGKVKKDIEYLSSDSISEDMVSKEYRDEFIFLKEGETYETEVSLIAFYIIGGSYEFIIPVNNLKGFFMSHKLVIKDGKTEPFKTIELPKSVEGYTLFTGDFLTNSVKVNF